jgi:hypothetical protein
MFTRMSESRRSADRLKRSERSGQPLEADTAVTVTYLFENGDRRAVTISAGEEDELRQQGEPRTTWWSRVRPSGGRWLKGVAKWLLIALAGGVIGQEISDRYADRQSELDLEAALITKISGDATKLFQDAQEASRAVGVATQRTRRDRAADDWVLASGSVTPVFRAYFDGQAVSRHWDAYQSAMYDWAVLGCCTTAPGRAGLIARIRKYVEAHVDNAPSPPRRGDPWRALDNAQPPPDAYQWLGRYLLRGRGQILNDLKAASPDLD